jgi:CheY-like chemotaxis protein
MGDIGSHILIVDDDEDTCVAFGDVLTDCGYKVEIARSGGEALEIAGRKSFRLALLDFRMPGLTGIDLYRRLRHLQNGIAGILITALITGDAESVAQAAGIQHILSKPVDMVELLTLIQELLNQM